MNILRTLAVTACFAGSLAASFAQSPGTWSGAGPDLNWSTGNNWAAGTPPTAFDLVYFEDFYFNQWTNKIGAVNNVVDVNTAVAALYYSAYAKSPNLHYYTTRIPLGVTLTVGGFGAVVPTMAVGDIPGSGGWSANGFTNYTTITGAGTLFVNDAAGKISVGGSSATAGIPGTFLDMTNLFTFTANVAYFYQAVTTDNPYANSPGGQVFMARTNNLTTIADGGLTPGFLLGSSVGVANNFNAVNGINHVLGAVNNYNMDALAIGGANSANVSLGFTNCNITIVGGSNFLQNAGNFKLRGSAGGLSRTAIFSIADQAARPGTMQGTTSANFTGPATGAADFRNGTVDIMVDKLIVGHAAFDGANVRSDVNTGTLRYENGTIDANNVYIGYAQGTNGCFAIGNIFLTSNAVMNVNNNYYMAYAPDKTYIKNNVVSTNFIMDNAVLNIGGNLQHSDGAFLATNTASTLALGGGTINMLNNGNVSLFNLYGFGTITNAFSIAISNSFSPGTPGPVPSVATLNLGGNVAFLGTFPINFDLGTVTNKGGTNNDYVNILGDVSFNNNVVTFLPSGPLQSPGTYRLIDYTGTKSGTLQFVNPTRSPLVLDQTTAGRIQLSVPSWTPATLDWNGVTNLNWTYTNATPAFVNWGVATNQYFLQFDNVRFNDSVTNIGGNRVFTNVCLVNGILYPSSIYITNNNSLYISNRGGFGVADGAFRGACSVTKDGPGTLFWTVGSLTNLFTGDVRINQGVLRLHDTTGGTQGKLLLGFGSIYVTNGATLDITNIGSFGAGNPLYISGTGMTNYTGGGAAGDGVLTGGQNLTAKWLKVRLANDATISTWNGTVALGGNSGLGNPSPPVTDPAGLIPMGRGELSLNGYTLTVQGTNNKFLLLEDVVATNTGNIIVAGTMLNIRRTTITGPGTITFTNKSALGFIPPSAGFAWSGFESTIGKNIVATNWVVQGETNTLMVLPHTNIFTGTVSIAEDLNNLPPNYRGMLVSNFQSIQFDGPISGDTSLYKVGPGPLILNAANTYTSNTIVNGGTVVLGPSGSIASKGTTLNPALPTTTLDVSAASYALGSGQWLNLNGNVPADVVVKGNATVGNGATLFGSGTINGSLTVAAGSEIAPGGTNNTGQIVVSNNLTMNGAHLTWDVTPSFATSDGLVVNGNLNLSGVNTFTIDAIGGFGVGGTNTLITYTGGLSGGLANLALNNPSVRYVQTFLDPATTPGKIQVVLTAPPGNLTWTGTDATHPTWWDLKTTTNWLNASTNDVFWSADYVTFDSSGMTNTVDLGAAGPSLKPLTPGNITVDSASYVFQGTNGLITSSLMVTNGATLVVSNRQDNQIIGFGTTVMTGTTLTFKQATNASLYSDLYGGGVINKSITTNRLRIVGDAAGWFGSINVNAGQIAAGQSNAISGPVAVAAGATLDLGGQAIPGAVVTAQGVGVDGLGAINNRVNVSTNLVGWQSNVVNSLTLGADTTIGSISNSWGIGGLVGGGFNLTKTNVNDVWIMTATDTDLGDINVRQGRLIFARAGTGLGNTAKTITVYPGATLGFATTNYTSTPIGNGLQQPPAYNASLKNLIFANTAVFQMSGFFGGLLSTGTFSGPITFTNDLNLTLDNNTVSTLYGNITGPAASATPNFGSLVINGSGFNVINLFGTNTYASNTWVKSSWLNISNQLNIPTNTTLILSNSAVPTLPIQLTVLGGGEFTNRNLLVSSSNMAVTVQGNALWWGRLTLQGNLGLNLNASNNGGLDLAFTNINTALGVGGPFRIGGFSTRIRSSLNLKVAPGTITPSGTMEIGYIGAPTVQFDSTNNWLTLILSGGRINWNTNDVLPAGGSITNRGGCLMDLHGFNQSISHVRDATPFGGTAAFFNDSPAFDSTLTIVPGNYAQPNGFTNCTTVMLSDTTNLITPKKLNLTVTGGLTELLNTNTYTGPTVVTGGKLLLGNYTTNTTVFSGTLSSSASVTVSGAGVFGGNGLVASPVTINAGGTLIPGECLQFYGSAAIFPPAVVTRTGQLRFGNTPLALNPGSTTIFNVDNTTNAVTLMDTNASVVGLSAVTYGGTLIVSNISNVPFTNNQVVKLFDAVPGNYTGSFATIKVWGALSYDASQLTVDGTIKILTATSTAPFSITKSRPDKNHLILSWPADHIGWRLQIMTNTSAFGMVVGGTTNFVQSTNWVDCDNGTAISSTNITIGTTNVVFRLTYP